MEVLDATHDAEFGARSREALVLGVEKQQEIMTDKQKRAYLEALEFLDRGH